MAKDWEILKRTQENEEREIVKFLRRVFGKDGHRFILEAKRTPTIPNPDDHHSNAD